MWFQISSSSSLILFDGAILKVDKGSIAWSDIRRIDVEAIFACQITNFRRDHYLWVSTKYQIGDRIVPWAQIHVRDAWPGRLICMSLSA